MHRQRMIVECADFEVEAAGIEPAQHFARPQVRGRAPSMSLYEMMPA
jgi:hypothetical protein